MATFNLTNHTLDNLRAATKRAVDLQLPQKASFALLKNNNEITKHLKDYDEKLQALFTECGAKDDDGNLIVKPREGGMVTVQIDPAKAEEFGSRRLDLDTFVVENVVIHMVSDAIFESRDTIAPKDLALVAWMIEGLSTLESE